MSLLHFIKGGGGYKYVSYVVVCLYYKKNVKENIIKLMLIVKYFLKFD